MEEKPKEASTVTASKLHSFTYQPFDDYQLLDCGEGAKLERFGKVILQRPEPQAVWSAAWPKKQWEDKQDAIFIPGSSNSGEWVGKLPPQWVINYPLEKEVCIFFNLKGTGFKHIGIFPEQAANWQYIYHWCKGRKAPRVLNLFAYTGGATLAAKAGGADVVHLDSVKNVVNWARENMELSRLKNIRWVVEDALKFLQREAKRGNKYDALLMDPPAYGIGAKGERWKLEEGLQPLMHAAWRVLASNGMLLLNTYSLNMSSATALNFLPQQASAYRHLQHGELLVPAASGRCLPLGCYLRVEL